MADIVTVTGIKDALAAVNATPQVARRTILDMSVIAHDKLLEGAGRHTKTGALHASAFNRRVDSDLARMVGHDLDRAPYARWVIGGAKPHTIRPKEPRKALRWVVGNGFVFARKVNHPGYEGDNYLNPAAQAALAALDDILSRNIKEAME